MQIIHVTDELMPSSGGLVSVPVNLAAAQASAGHAVSILGRTGLKQLLESNETTNIPNFDKVRVADCGQPGWIAKLFPCKAKRVLKKHIAKNSIVHLHGVWDPILLLASKIARKTGASYIVTPHSMLHPWQMERYGWQKKVVFSIGWKRMLDEALFIQALTEAEKGFIQKFNFTAPVEIIPNGIYPEALRLNKANPFLARYPNLQKAPYILFLSRLSRQKGIDLLLDGFERFASKCPEVHLVIAGPDYGELSFIKDKLNSMKHVGRILLPGPLYGQDKLGALHGASCFTLTSRNEGFSIAVLEALACGLPVVISENCFFPEVTHHSAGIIAQSTAVSIGNAFHEIFDSPSLQDSMKTNAKILAEESYHWNMIDSKLWNLYEKHVSK